MSDGRDVYWEARDCLLAIRSRIRQLGGKPEPAAYVIDTPAETAGVHDRANLTFFRAMLTGSLMGWFVNGGERWQIPGWAWADHGGDWEAAIGLKRFLHPLLPEPYGRWADCEVLVDRAAFEAWLASDEIAAEDSFPELPPAYDEASRPSLITAKPLPERPTVTLSEAVSWLVFGMALDSDTLHAALNCDAFGTDFAVVQAKLKNAIDRLTTAGTGGLSMYGKMLRAGDEPDRALTEAIPSERFHDFRQFDVISDGLWHGEGISWERTGPNAITRALLVSNAQLRDVKVSRAGLSALVHASPAVTPARAGRRKGDGSMAGADAPLLVEMRELIDRRQAFSPNAAALMVASKASGSGTPESKAARLRRRYSELQRNGAQ